MMKRSTGSNSKRGMEEGDEGGWKREFSIVVQDVVKQDAGWKYVPLFDFSRLLTVMVFVSDSDLLPPTHLAG